MSDMRSNAIKLTTVGLLLLAAGALVLRHLGGGSDEALPATDETATAWYCVTCQKGIELSASQYAEQMRYGVHPADTATPGDMPRTVAMAPCPHCGKWAVAARKCPQDGAIFDGHPTGASKGVCPTCGWDPNGENTDD